MILLTVSVAINYLDRGALSVAAPLIINDLSLSPAQMGLLFSAFFWSYSSFQLVAGWLVDRFSIKWIYAGGYLIWSLATAAVGLVHGLSALLAARLLLGIGESVAYPASSKIIVRYFPEERRGLANALVDAGAKLGPGFSTLLGGLTVATYGWRAMFLFAGLASLLWLVRGYSSRSPTRRSHGRRSLRARDGVSCCDAPRFGEPPSECSHSAMFFISFFPGCRATLFPNEASR